jgi:hypothetical protein
MQFAVELPWARRSDRPQIEIPNVDLPKVDLAARVEDTKRVVGDGAETITAVAQDLGTQAAVIGREAVKIGKDAAKISRDAARKGQKWASTSGRTFGQLRSDAASTVDDLRSIRIVRQRGPDWRPGAAMIVGAGAGIAAMFFLDPEHGRTRRIFVMEKAHKYARISNEWLDATARDLRNRSQGWALEARKMTDQARGNMPLEDDDVVSSTPDVSDKLASTDWTDSQSPTLENGSPATESYRS